MIRTCVALATCVLLVDCNAHRVEQTPAEPPVAPAPPSTMSQDAAAPASRSSNDDLIPGTVRAFGLLLPQATAEVFSNDSTKIFYVQATLPRVMRYLERRLDIPNAEIHPLGAMLRGAHVRTTPDGENRFIDVGLREESDRTMLTVWNRTAAAVSPRTPEEGLHAAGFDPSGRPLPENNR